MLEENGAVIAGGSVSNNTMIAVGGGNNINYFVGVDNSQLTGAVTVANNYFDPTSAFGPWRPGQSGADVSYSGNVNMTSGQLFSGQVAGTATTSSSSSALTFTYTVAPDRIHARLAATAVNLNGATVTDGAGNAANLSVTGPDPTGPCRSTPRRRQCRRWWLPAPASPAARASSRPAAS